MKTKKHTLFQNPLRLPVGGKCIYFRQLNNLAQEVFGLFIHNWAIVRSVFVENCRKCNFLVNFGTKVVKKDVVLKQIVGGRGLSVVSCLLQFTSSARAATHFYRQHMNFVSRMLLAVPEGGGAF
ncbi:MAG: hypothetical protein VZQ80_01805 [Lachnospiraceae bacterium]|nr:hypothetical protein [Lachnospiraceae bacterium]